MSHSWNEIENHWIQLKDKPKFDLSIPCIVINKDGDLFENTLKDLVSYIDIPSNLSRELLFNYLSLTIEMGSEAAKQMIFDNGQSIGQEFFNQLKLVNEFARNTTLGTIDDVLHAIKLAENGFSTLPRKMLIIQLGEYRADLLLVSPPSNAGRKEK